jgi:cytochrome b561
MTTHLAHAGHAPAHAQTSAKSIAAKHSKWTIAFHWSSVLAIVLATATILLREEVESSGLRNALLEIHRQAGVFVLLALVLRLAIRFTVGMADHAGDMPAIMRVAALLAHVALYVMLCALPVLGWAVTNAHGVQVKLMGVIQLPMLVAADSDLADTLTDYHSWAAWAMLALVVAHVAAALWHHFVRRDGVLTAMLPTRQSN